MDVTACFFMNRHYFYLLYLASASYNKADQNFERSSGIMINNIFSI